MKTFSGDRQLSSSESKGPGSVKVPFGEKDFTDDHHHDFMTERLLV